MVTGDVHGVEALLDAWLDPDHPAGDMIVHDHAEVLRPPVRAAMYRAGLALRRGDLDGTVTHGARAADLSSADDHLGRGAAALDLLAEAERRYDTDHSPRTHPVAATTARVRIGSGDLAGAERWVADTGLTPDDDPAHLREYEHLTLAHQAGGDTPQALAQIADAPTRAADERFVRVFLDSGPPMTALLRTAVRHGRAVGQASAVLAAATAPARAPAQHGPVDALSPRERDVLRLLRSELTGPEIAAELVVSLNTVRTHTRNIVSKLGVTNRRAAVRRAGELGLQPARGSPRRPHHMW